jgi:hypothetical protein
MPGRKGNGGRGRPRKQQTTTHVTPRRVKDLVRIHLAEEAAERKARRWAAIRRAANWAMKVLGAIVLGVLVSVLVVYVRRWLGLPSS